MTGKNGPRLTHPPPVPAAPRRRIHRATSRRVGATKPRSGHRELIGTRIARIARIARAAAPPAPRHPAAPGTAGDPSISNHEHED
ncbi:hypothetical protein GCM10022226_51850 [Sphaerisporangium flaviroseum]|uniref:Uncharacterized protein n=1 Tax=Sphaerisporangium flaviroseum TaxID=509199 RepID=A0ABP7IQY6_9ACTN